jgi:hypothetical protein
MTARPLVSVVVPTRDSGRFLAETLESVAAQTLANHEVVVVDAGSTDDTLEIAARHAKARVISQRSTGLSGGWNEGIAAARGELVAFLDSDDLWHPRKLELQAAYLAGHPDVELVATRMRFFLSPGEVLPPAYLRPGLLDTDHASLFPGNILVRTRLFGVVGRFDSSLAIAGDMDWFARIQDRQIATHVLPETLYFKRLHAGNLSHGPVARQVWTRELTATVRASIRRKRQGDAGLPAEPAASSDRVSSVNTGAAVPSALVVPDRGREAGADRFLSWLDACITATAADISDLVGSAEAAAARYVCDGQDLGISGDEGLVCEGIGRSGGMIAMKRASPPGRPVAADWQGIVLCFPRESGLADDVAEIHSFLRAGRHVVMFGRDSIRAAAEAAGVRPHAFVKSHATEHGGLFQDAQGGWIVPTEHAADIVAFWAWLGEFIAACTRLGRMPVIYQSYDVPGARQRPERFRGMKFHAEPPVPMAAGQAARRYLAVLAATVERFRGAERESVRQAATAAVEAKLRGRRLYAFPHNHTLLRGRLGGPHDPGDFAQLNADWFRVKPLLPVDRGDVVFCVGYSRIYAGGKFGNFADAMRARGVRLIWSLASYDPDPVCGVAGIHSDEIFIDQHWGYGDAVVECPGQDVGILPTSGVLAETVMWSVVSDMHAELGGR